MQIMSVGICDFWLETECSQCGHGQVVGSEEDELRILISVVFYMISSVWAGCIPRQVVIPLQVAFSM